MSFGGRRSVNVTEYIAQLNTVPGPEEPLDSPTGLDEDLALFTSNQFVNWDGPSAFDQNTAPFDVNFEQPSAAATTTDPKMDFDLSGK